VAYEINTHGLKVDFGKHRGELWTRVPVSYLRWLVNMPSARNSNAKAIAAAELKRRGSTLPTIELSGHAIDRASLSCRKIWHQTAHADEGLYSWLCRIGREALDSTADGLEGHSESRECEIEYLGLKLVFALGEFYPTIKTVHPQ
jgi:hypothetical protein